MCFCTAFQRSAGWMGHAFSPSPWENWCLAYSLPIGRNREHAWRTSSIRRWSSPARKCKPQCQCKPEVKSCSNKTSSSPHPLHPPPSMPSVKGTPRETTHRTAPKCRVEYRTCRRMAEGSGQWARVAVDGRGPSSMGARAVRSSPLRATAMPSPARRVSPRQQASVASDSADNTTTTHPWHLDAHE